PSGRMIKGLIGGCFGLNLTEIAREPVFGDTRFIMDILELNSAVTFINMNIGGIGVGEVLKQKMTHNKDVSQRKPIAQLGQWLPDRKTSRTLVKPTIVGGATGSVIGLVPAVGGDISGIIGWDNARRLSKEKEQFGKGSLKGLMAGDTSTTTTLGGSVTTTMALGIPGDSVMAVLIGSMMIWGIQPGPGLFASNPSMVYSLVAILAIATVLSLALSLIRMKSMVKLLELNNAYLWIIILL